MSHPKREEWVPYVFGESNAQAHRHLSAHLDVCSECRAEVQAWKKSLNRLDAWKVPAAPRQLRLLGHAINWAAAAAVVLLVGFGVGRVSATKVDLVKVRTAIEPQIRQEVSQQVERIIRAELARNASATVAASSQQTEQALAALAKALQEARAEDNRAVSAALKRLETQTFAQFVALKKDLDTVAMNTDASLRDTAQQLVQLVDYRPFRQK